MIQDNRNDTGYCSPAWVRCYVDYQDTRPQALKLLAGCWRFNDGDPDSGIKKNGSLRTLFDLRRWARTPDVGIDYMTKIITMKSTNKNVICLYINNGEFLFSVLPTNMGDSNEADTWFSFKPDCMQAIHDFRLDYVLTKPGNPTGFVKLLYNGKEIFRHMRTCLVMEPENGSSHYWLLGIDQRANRQPPNIDYRKLRFAICHHR